MANLCNVMCPGQKCNLSQACCCLFPKPHNVNEPDYRGQLAITNESDGNDGQLAITAEGGGQNSGRVINNYFVNPPPRRHLINPQDHYEMRQLLPNPAEAPVPAILPALEN